METIEATEEMIFDLEAINPERRTHRLPFWFLAFELLFRFAVSLIYAGPRSSPTKITASPILTEGPGSDLNRRLIVATSGLVDVAADY
jgi:hypothetical protein